MWRVRQSRFFVFFLFVLCPAFAPGAPPLLTKLFSRPLCPHRTACTVHTAPRADSLGDTASLNGQPCGSPAASRSAYSLLSNAGVGNDHPLHGTAGQGSEHCPLNCTAPSTGHSLLNRVATSNGRSLLSHGAAASRHSLLNAAKSKDEGLLNHGAIAHGRFLLSIGTTSTGQCLNRGIRHTTARTTEPTTEQTAHTQQQHTATPAPQSKEHNNKRQQHVRQNTTMGTLTLGGHSLLPFGATPNEPCLVGPRTAPSGQCPSIHGVAARSQSIPTPAVTVLDLPAWSHRSVRDEQPAVALAAAMYRTVDHVPAAGAPSDTKSAFECHAPSRKRRRSFVLD